ncbi:MAG: glycosyltransferase family 2 protein, partial [Candidatus Levybacteria bacterium]|nr:glycosyltransferase family 2 protein [Candidatus Levybacteria bacterium]
MNNFPDKKISIIIPVFNEEQNIKHLVERIHASLSKAEITYELIFVDDHSTDQTRNVISNLAIFYPIILVEKKGKRGKAFSIYEGIKYAQYDAVGMIDADLQYGPENFVGMLEELENFDLIVANRKHYRDSLLRKIFSKTFRFAFGRFLFGLDHDIQAGLKVFTRRVWETVKFMPHSAWTFDLEFLHRAKQAGFKIQKHNIIFYKRKNGKSNVNFVKQTAEIGINALRVRVKRIHPAHIPPSDKYSMLGAGVGHRKRKYITHTTIPHHTTALKTATLSQKLIILLLLTDIVLGLYINPLLTLQILVGVLSAIYFIDVLFNFYMITKSLGKTNEITSSDEE